MSSSKNRQILMIVAAVLFIVTAVTLIIGQIIGNNRTDIEADLSRQNVVTSYIDDSNSALLFSTENMGLVSLNFDGTQKWTFATDDEKYKDKVNYIFSENENTYVSLLNKRKVLVLNSQSGEIKKVFSSIDPISYFVVSEENGLLSVISEQGSKNYITFFDINNETADINSASFDDANFTPFLSELEFSTKVVNVIFKGDSIFYALRNGMVYSLKSDMLNEKPSLYLNTEIMLSGAAFTQNGAFVCVSDKAIIKQYNDRKLTVSLSLNKDVFCVGANNNSNLLAIGTRYSEMEFYNASSGKVETRLKVFNEPSEIKLSANGKMTVLEGRTFSAKIFDVDKLPILATFNVVNIVFLILTIAFALFLIFALLNFFARTREKQNYFFKNVGGILWKHKKSYLILLPSFVLLGIFNYFPAIWSFILAFTEYKPGVYTRFIGFANFQTMFLNEYFWVGTGNMLIFLVTDLLKALIPPVIIAELIFALRSKRVKYWARVLMYVPGILPGIAGLMIWTTGILGMEGLINMLFNSIGLSHLVTDWLGNPNTALWALVFIGFPYIGGYLLFYGSLMSVPESLMEAAKIDGCNWFMRIIKIDVPLMGPQLKYVFVTGFIGSIQDFGRVWLTTGGGPGNSTYIPALELYNNINIFNNYGLASAMGMFLFIIIFGVTLFNMKIKTNSGLG